MNSSKPIARLPDGEARSGQSWEAAIQRDNSRNNLWQRTSLLVGLGLAWGGITSFSMAFEDMETKIQAAALLIACIGAFLVFRQSILVAWVNSTQGILIAAHVMAAALSGLHSDGPPENILRYAALLPAFSLLLSVARGGFQAVEKVRLGLTIAGLILVVFHLVQLDFGSITDPLYRIAIFLNPNSTAFIAAMTGLSAAEWALRRTTRNGARMFWICVVLCCAVLLFGTKSRTAFLAMTAGAFVFGWLRFRTPLARVVAIAVILLGVAYAIHHREAITDTLSLDEKDRTIQTGTGRYEIWNFLLTSVIPEHLWLGVGPGQHNDLVFAATGSTNSHNGFLTSLSDTGIVGTLPVLLLTILSFYTAWQRRKLINQAWVAALFIAGIVESLGESVFFSIGNPASLLFMLAVATLARPLPPDLQSAPDPEEDADRVVSRKLLPRLAQ